MPHWQDYLTTCVAEIDAEHRILFRLLTRLDADRATETVEELHRFLQDHFVHEQRLMEESSYPDRVEHRLQHDHLAGRVQHFRRSTPAWTLAHLHELRSLLSQWLETHISVHDKALALWYAAWKAEARRSGAAMA